MRGYSMKVKMKSIRRRVGCLLLVVVLFAGMFAGVPIKAQAASDGTMMSNAVQANFGQTYFKAWTKNWNFSLEQILEISKSAEGKINPMSYLNKILADMFAKGIKEDAEIKKYLKSYAKSETSKSTTKQNDFESRTYSQEELSAVFDSLDDVEI